MPVECKPIHVRSSGLEAQSTRRRGIRERKLLCAHECPHQNIVLIDADEGAVVEMHPSPTSETIVVLRGRFVITHDSTTTLMEEGDLYHFPAGDRHGLRCERGPGQYLVIFAPPLLRTPSISDQG